MKLLNFFFIWFLLLSDLTTINNYINRLLINQKKNIYISWEIVNIFLILIKSELEPNKKKRKRNKRNKTVVISFSCSLSSNIKQHLYFIYRLIKFLINKQWYTPCKLLILNYNILLNFDKFLLLSTLFLFVIHL